MNSDDDSKNKQNKTLGILILIVIIVLIFIALTGNIQSPNSNSNGNSPITMNNVTVIDMDVLGGYNITGTITPTIDINYLRVEAELYASEGSFIGSGSMGVYENLKSGTPITISGNGWIFRNKQGGNIDKSYTYTDGSQMSDGDFNAWNGEYGYANPGTIRLYFYDTMNQNATPIAYYDIDSSYIPAKKVSSDTSNITKEIDYSYY